jgi:hypothetical protein
MSYTNSRTEEFIEYRARGRAWVFYADPLGRLSIVIAYEDGHYPIHDAQGEQMTLPMEIAPAVVQQWNRQRGICDEHAERIVMDSILRDIRKEKLRDRSLRSR